MYSENIENAVIVVKYEGVYCILDGHHRLANHILNGNEEVVVKCIENNQSTIKENKLTETLAIGKTLKEIEKENKSTLPKIKTEKIFGNKISKIPYENRLLIDKYIEENFDSIPYLKIKVKDLSPTQLNLNINNLKEVEEVELPIKLENKQIKKSVKETKELKL